MLFHPAEMVMFLEAIGIFRRSLKIAHYNRKKTFSIVEQKVRKSGLALIIAFLQPKSDVHTEFRKKEKSISGHNRAFVSKVIPTITVVIHCLKARLFRKLIGPILFRRMADEDTTILQ